MTMRAALDAALGGEAVVDAASVLGNFNQLNPLADATGMPVGDRQLAATAELRAASGIEPFHMSGPRVIGERQSPPR